MSNKPLLDALARAAAEREAKKQVARQVVTRTVAAGVGEAAGAGLASTLGWIALGAFVLWGLYNKFNHSQPQQPVAPVTPASPSPGGFEWRDPINDRLQDTIHKNNQGTWRPSDDPNSPDYVNWDAIRGQPRERTGEPPPQPPTFEQIVGDPEAPPY